MSARAPLDLGILFRPELYTAIVEGRKTETRRLPNGGWARCRRGDTLWVREKLECPSEPDGTPGLTRYARDGAPVDPPMSWRWSRSWLSPLHMPRAAARLRLRLVEDARVEPIDAIDNAAAGREGVRAFGASWGFTEAIEDVRGGTPREAFLRKWAKVHPDSGPGELVVVLRFEVVVRPRIYFLNEQHELPRSP